ncbi:MAG: ABC transporter ATP-binding protein [Dehalococcoidia bacterium]|nr:MAG: ABC transporter ATP-binding protein [Dehalococcoidia bacterium]
MLKARIKRALPGFELDVDFCLNRELLAVLGPSGSGKTMTLQCIAGLTRPDEGRIELNGKVLFDSAEGINLAPQKRRVGFVFQNYALFPHMTVSENVAYSIRHLPASEISEKVGRLLNIMNVSPLAGRYPRQLSAGQQQRVAIARALAPDPEVLLLDEPFSALDSQLKERLELELLALQREYRGSMLLVTHDLAEGYKLGSQIAIYQAGRIAQCDTKQKVFAQPVNRTVARLTGVRNLMDGAVARIEPPYLWVHVTAWNTGLKALAGEDSHLTLGQKVAVGIRPEYVDLRRSDGENVFSSRILQVVEGISSVTYRLHVDSDQQAKHYINAAISKSSAICVEDGQTCLLYLPPEHLIVIPE